MNQLVLNGLFILMHCLKHDTIDNDYWESEAGEATENLGFLILSQGLHYDIMENPTWSYLTRAMNNERYRFAVIQTLKELSHKLPSGKLFLVGHIPSGFAKADAFISFADPLSTLDVKLLTEDDVLFNNGWSLKETMTFQELDVFEGNLAFPEEKQAVFRIR
ncbi:hypothetical protein [Vibrio mediterranei]|uniref:hypothetical protein n=1 Tax=Vibrio mediterranei TaxID=689 RepID=UPI00406946E2